MFAKNVAVAPARMLFWRKVLFFQGLAAVQGVLAKNVAVAPARMFFWRQVLFFQGLAAVQGVLAKLVAVQGVLGNGVHHC